MTVNPIVWCSTGDCYWRTVVLNEAVATLAAVRELRHHLVENHGRSDTAALHEAFGTVSEAVLA